MSTLHYALYYVMLCYSLQFYSYIFLVVFLFTLQQGVSFCFAVTDSCAIAQSWAGLGNHDRNALQEPSFFVLFVWYHGGCIYQNKLVEYSFIIMLQSNCKPLTAAAVFRPCNEMEDESDWHCAKGYCQCNTTSVIPPVRKAMSVKRRCLGRLSQNMPQWQISRKELHPLEGKLIDLNLFVWGWHCQLQSLEWADHVCYTVLTGGRTWRRGRLLVAGTTSLKGPTDSKMCPPVPSSRSFTAYNVVKKNCG